LGAFADRRQIEAADEVAALIRYGVCAIAAATADAEFDRPDLEKSGRIAPATELIATA
jgi:hypothetical protein